MHIVDRGIAALGEGAQQIERRRRLPIGLDLPPRIGDARFRRERDVVDDVAAIARQFDAVDLLDRRGARLGELPGDAADLHHRHGAGIGQHDRHLQEDAEEIADVVGAVLGEAFGAVAALQQEGLARGYPRQRLFQVAGLACKNQRRKRGKLRLDIGQCLGIGIIGHCCTGLVRQLSGVHRSDMTLTPEQKPLLKAEERSGRVIHRPRPGPPVGFQPSSDKPLRQKPNSHLLVPSRDERRKSRWQRLRWTTFLSTTSPSPLTDGYLLGATLFLPRGAKRHAVLINSATAVPRKIYRGFAGYLARRGCAVLTYDYRGTGDSRQKSLVGYNQPKSLVGFKASMSDWAALDVTRRGGLDARTLQGPAA